MTGTRRQSKSDSASHCSDIVPHVYQCLDEESKHISALRCICKSLDFSSPNYSTSRRRKVEIIRRPSALELDVEGGPLNTSVSGFTHASPISELTHHFHMNNFLHIDSFKQYARRLSQVAHLDFSAHCEPSSSSGKVFVPMSDQCGIRRLLSSCFLKGISLCLLPVDSRAKKSSGFLLS